MSALLRKEICCLKKRVKVLEAASPTLQVVRKTIAQNFEYAIAAEGAVSVLGDRTDAPIPVVTFVAGTGANGAGNDYVVTFPVGTPLVGAYIVLVGDINTGSGAGATNNALIPQNITVTANVVNFTLYTGDDGAGNDDARRRDTRLLVTVDCAVIADIVGISELDMRLRESFGDIVVNEAARMNSGWANQPILGATAFTDDVELTFELGSSVPNTATMIGLNTDPNTDANFNSIDFALYLLHNSAGQPTLFVYESGVFRGSFGAVPIGAELSIRRVGALVEYLLGGAVIYTSTVSSSDSLYADSSAFGNTAWNGDITLLGLEVVEL